MLNCTLAVDSCTYSGVLLLVLLGVMKRQADPCLEGCKAARGQQHPAEEGMFFFVSSNFIILVASVIYELQVSGMVLPCCAT